MKSEAPGRNRLLQSIRRIVFCLLVVVLAALTVSYYVRRSRLATTFARIQIGESKESLVQILGTPTEVATCRDPNPSVDRSQKCAETYWYNSFLERWGFALNADGKIIDKVYNVSY